jgi:hypothetical protein
MQQKQQIMIKSLAAVCLDVEAKAVDCCKLVRELRWALHQGTHRIVCWGRFLVGAPGGTVMHQQLANVLRQQEGSRCATAGRSGWCCCCELAQLREQYPSSGDFCTS